MSTTQRSKFRLITVLCATALVSLVGIGCSDDDVPGVDTSVYYGVGSDPSPIPFVINLQGTSFDPATSGQALGGGGEVALEGTVTPAGGGAVAVDGAINAGSVAFSGPGWTFAGTVSGNTIQGVANTPNGTGAFVLFIGGAPANVTLYCGSGSCTLGCSGSASITLAVAGSSAILAANLDDGPVALSGGVVTGSSVSFDQTVAGNHIIIDGTIGAGVITNGTFSTDNSDPLDNPDPQGTWTADSAACTSAP